ncbi:MAG: hypothetical protein ACK4E9_02005 [Aeromonas media]
MKPISYSATSPPKTEVGLSNHLRHLFPANTSSISRRKPILQVGVNDADYVTQPMVDGVRFRCPAYITWKHVLTRACDYKFQAKKPTYRGVTISKEWHSFMGFRDWWENNHVDGYQLDKDLLFAGNREYGPMTCVYVPPWLNTFTTDHSSARGDFPIGVYRHKGKLMARCCNPITGKEEFLGYFSLPENAYQAWLTRKLELADALQPLMDAIDQRIHPTVCDTIRNAR